MAVIEKDGFSFYEGFFEGLVFNFENYNIELQLKYIKANKIKRVSLSKDLEDLSFLKEIDFIEEIYLSKTPSNYYSGLYFLLNLKRLVVNVEKSQPNIDYSRFSELEILSIDWYSKFPNLSNNLKLKELSIWKFRPKSKNFAELKLPPKLIKLHITESNIINLDGLSLKNLKVFEAHYCGALKSLKGIKNFGLNLNVLILDYCKKLTNYDEIKYSSELNEIILGDCGNIPDIKWLNKMSNVSHFSFWGTVVDDGDISPCIGIDYVSFIDKKHYNHKRVEFKHEKP